jgi:hypothetical protein
MSLWMVLLDVLMPCQCVDTSRQCLAVSLGALSTCCLLCQLSVLNHFCQY